MGIDEEPVRASPVALENRSIGSLRVEVKGPGFVATDRVLGFGV